jgi:L-threonylcarbamoyladenylate synthase
MEKTPKTTSSISLPEAAELIRAGALVAFPTETVYGLGANALDACAVAKIYDLKGRPRTSPLIVHVASIDMAKNLASDWPPIADDLAQRHWPGPLTIVVSKSSQIPDIVTAGLPTVGLRMPADPIALELIRQAGVPIAAPSANRFMHLSPTRPEHVFEEFGDAVPILEGAPSKVGIESTVVSVVNGRLELLRPGMISIAAETAATPDGAHPSPGMHPRHYSPRTRLILVNSFRELPDHDGAFVWWKKPFRTARSIRMPAEPAAYAARLYDVLHRLDAESWPWIAVEAPPDTPEWSAIRDRLCRAAS